MTSASRPHGRTPGERADGYALTIVGSAIVDGCLCLQYAVSPVPPALVGDRALHEGEDAGLAIDSRRHVYRTCRSAYRTARSGDRVIGALKIGPAKWPQLGVIRVLFAPLAHTSGLRDGLRAVRVTIDAARVRSTRVCRV